MSRETDASRFLRHVLDAVPDTILVFDPDTGRPLYWNRAFRDASGASDDEIAASRAPGDWYDAGDPAARLETDRGYVDTTLLAKDGRRVPTEVRTTAVDAAGEPGRAVVAVGRAPGDRIERRAAGDASAASGVRVRELANSVPGVVYQLRRAPDGTLSVPFISDQAESYLGHPAAAIVADPSLLFGAVHEADRARVAAAIERSAASLSAYSLESRILVAGAIRWHHVESVPRRLPDGTIEWHGVSMDITRLKAAESDLRASEQKYRSLIENIPDAVAVIDPGGNHVLVNEAVVRMSGRTRDEIMSTNFRDMLPNHEQTPFYQAIMRVMETREPELVVDRVAPANVPPRWIQMAAYPVPEGVMFFSRDISAQKAMEDRVRRAEKLESIGTLAGGVAHDFNNMLMGIQGRVSLLLEADVDELTRADLLEIEAIVRNAATLTRQLLGFARGGRYEVVVTDANQLVRDTVAMFARTHKQLRVHTQSDPELCTVRIDRDQVEQVLLNLLVNAGQALPAGGDIYVETRNLYRGIETTGPFDLEPGRFVQIAVTDTGVGMEPETLERIFEPFFTTRELGRGTGLGLASAYGVVRSHGGMLLAESQPGAGTTLTVELPACDEPVAPSPPAAETRLATGTETVLIIDDEEVARGVTERMLTRLGYQTIGAESGREGLALLEVAGRVDLVILDMILPGEKAADIFAALRARAPSLKVLIASGYSDGQATHLLEAGCDGFIQKPFRLATAAAKLREVLDR